MALYITYTTRLNSAYHFVTVEYTGADSSNVSFHTCKISGGVSPLKQQKILYNLIFCFSMIPIISRASF